MTYILANGCSFTKKDYGYKDNFWHTDEEKIKLGIPLNPWPMWPEHVANRLEMDHVNLGKNGSSNREMYERTSQYIFNHKPPAVVMHLWTCGYRSNYHHWTLPDHYYHLPIELANLLMNRDSQYLTSPLTKAKFTRTYYSLAFHNINYFYPDEYESCRDFYISLCNDYTDMYTIQSIDKVDVWWGKFALIALSGYYLELHSMSHGRFSEAMDQRISDELEPYYLLYRLCRRENIPVVTNNGMPLGGSLGSYRSPRHYKIEHKVETHRGVKERNVFETMLLGSMRMCNYISSNWIYNNYFNELDRLVNSDKYVIYNWPAIKGLTHEGTLLLHEQYLDGYGKYKPISYADNHPNWDTQKLIGDFFYDLYKKLPDHEQRR